MIGDHIRALKGGRWIHGIDGGDKTVLHLGDHPGPRVLRTYGPLFVEGAETVEVVTHREPVYPPRSVVARAWSPVRDPALGEMFRDSEAFARWCKSGRLPETSPAPAPAGTRPAPAAARASPPTPAAGAARPPARRSAPRRKIAGKARGATARKAPAGKPPARKRPAARKARPKRR